VSAATVEGAQDIFLPPLPSTPLPRRAAGGAGAGAEFGAGLMRVGGLEDFALLTKRLLGK